MAKEIYEGRTYFNSPGVPRREEINLAKLREFKLHDCLCCVRDIVCKTFNIKVTDFHKESEETIRKKAIGISDNVYKAKQLFCYFVKKEVFKDLITQQQIASFIYPDYNHSSVIHCIKTAQNRIDNNTIPVSDLSRIRFGITLYLNTLWRSFVETGNVTRYEIIDGKYFIMYNGNLRRLTHVCKELGLNVYTVRDRVKSTNIPIEEILKPVRNKKVINIKTGQVYNSAAEMGTFLKLSPIYIRQICRRGVKNGKIPVMYYHDYINLKSET